MLGLGLGIDYSLLIVSRFQEELQPDALEQSVIRTVDAAGRAVFFSGLTVGIGLLSLLWFPVLLLRSLSIAGAIVVCISVAAALTLVPALLGLVRASIVGGLSHHPPGGRVCGGRSPAIPCVTASQR